MMTRQKRAFALCAALLVFIMCNTSEAQNIESIAGDGKPENVGQPFGVEIGPDGALYICETQNHVILRQDRATGIITTIAGNRTKGYSGDGGLATKAQLNEPYEIRFDQQGNIYFVERLNHLVRKIDARTGIISTIAGTGTKGFTGDGGPAIKAQLDQPHSIALDEKRSHLYIADISNHRIRRVNLKTGLIETVAGNGEKKPPTDGAIAAGKPMIGPRALFIEGDTMWIALREGHSLWSMSLSDGRLKHLAGTGKSGFSGDGQLAKAATFNGPKGVTVDKAGNIYIVDTENQTIRKIDGKTNIITTIAGTGPKARGYGGDGGLATQAKLDRPHGVCVDDKGVVYIGDSNNHRVRKVKP